MEEQEKRWKQLEQAVQQQTRYIKWQFRLTGAAAAGCGGLLALGCALLPRLCRLADQLEAALANLTDMIESMDLLATATQSAVGQTVEKLNAIQLEMLNRAIEDLAAITDTLASFLSIFS